MIDAIKKMQYILIFIGVLIFTIILMIVYNMYSFKKFKEENQNDKDDHLMYISSNKQFLQNLKKNVNEEQVEYSDEIVNNSKKIENNKNQLNDFAKDTSTNFKNVNNKSDKNERDIILNKTNISNVNTEIQNVNSTYAKEIDTIRQKQNNIQTNIGTFKYTDYEDVLTRVGRNEERINLSEDKQFVLSSNLGVVQSITIPKLQANIISIEGNFVTNTELESKLDDFFENDILPKHESLSNVVYKNKDDIFSHGTRIDTMNSRFDQYYTSNQIDTNFMKESAINDKFANYYTSNQIDTNFMKESAIDDKFANYYTSDQIDTNFMKESAIDDKFANYYTKTEANAEFIEEEL